jgi:cardiolipin synthase
MPQRTMQLAGWRRPLLAGLAMGFLALVSGCSLAHDQREEYRFPHSFTASDPTFRRSLDTFGTAVIGGNRAELLKNGDEIFPAMVQAIHDAKTTVDLESYIFADDAAGTMISDALIAAARRGVEVRLLVDGTGGRAGKLLAEMKGAGVRTAVYHPVRLSTIFRIGQRSHRKILVVDGTICFTGGMGIDKRWLGNARNENEWRDTHVRVTGPVAAQMQAVFSDDWTYTTGEILAGEKFYPRIEPAGTVDAQAIKTSRGDSSSLAKMLFYVAFQSAERSIHIQNAYFLPDRQFRAALLAAVKRGVDVKVMVPGKHIDIAAVRMASRHNYGELLQGGVKIYEYGGTMMHNKTTVVDGIFSTVGSINFDSLSMQNNAEESIAIYDRDFAARLEAAFVEDLEHCREMTYERWKRRGLMSRGAEVLSWFFAPLY